MSCASSPTQLASLTTSTLIAMSVQKSRTPGSETQEQHVIDMTGSALLAISGDCELHATAFGAFDSDSLKPSETSPSGLSTI